MADPTTNYEFNLPTVGGNVNTWGGLNNDNWVKLDDLLGGVVPIVDVDIDGGTLDDVVIGQNSPAEGNFTTGSFSGDVDMADNDLRNVGLITFDSSENADGDYITWVTTQGLLGHENGVNTWRLGSFNFMLNSLAIGEDNITTDQNYAPKVVLSGASPAYYLKDTDNNQAWATWSRDGNYTISDATSGNIVVTVEDGASQNQLRLASNGMVGINAPSPAFMLQVGGDFSAGRSVDQYVSLRGDSGGNRITGVSATGNPKPLFVSSDDNSNGVVLEAQSGDVSFSTSGVTWATMGANQCLGVGTLTPSSKLEVNSGASNDCAAFYSTDTSAQIAIADDAGLTAFVCNDGALSIRVGGNAGNVFSAADALVFNSDGNGRFFGRVGIGVSPSDALDVNGNAVIRGGDIYFNDSRQSGDFVRYTTQEGFKVYENGNFEARIGTNQPTLIKSVFDNTTGAGANVNINSTAEILRSTSSGKFKVDRQKVDPELVAKLHPVSFKSTHNADSGRRFTGFIAEEVEEVFPEASVDAGQNYDVRAIVAALVAKVQQIDGQVNPK